jgi:phospholipase C
VCPYFYWCWTQRFNRSYVTSSEDFRADAGTGKLPSLSLIIPDGQQSQHNLVSMTVGDTFIGAMVGAVERGPQWKSTAIFITYDDCGCFYDHVHPPAGRGLRNPMVIVSPWAKPTFTDHTEARQPYSMLAFIDHNFSLPPLSNTVAHSSDYSNAFDYGQEPLVGPKMTKRSISPHERQRVARALSRVEDDFT